MDVPWNLFVMVSNLSLSTAPVESFEHEFEFFVSNESCNIFWSIDCKKEFFKAFHVLKI